MAILDYFFLQHDICLVICPHVHDVFAIRKGLERAPYSLQSDNFLNLVKPTGHVMHQQFNIQQLYVLPTLYLCVLYLSESKQRLVPLTA